MSLLPHQTHLSSSLSLIFSLVFLMFSMIKVIAVVWFPIYFELIPNYLISQLFHSLLISELQVEVFPLRCLLYTFIYSVTSAVDVSSLRAFYYISYGFIRIITI